MMKVLINYKKKQNNNYKEVAGPCYVEAKNKERIVLKLNINQLLLAINYHSKWKMHLIVTWNV